MSAFIRYLEGGNYLDIIDLHGISRKTFYDALQEVAQAISKVCADVVSFPMRDVAKLEELSRDFFVRSGKTIAGCVGAVDGIVLPISQPSLLDVPNPQDYRNRKCPWALVYQVMVDAHLRVTWFSKNNTGNTNDSIAFECSLMSKELEARPMPWPYYIIGDDAYKASTQVVTPHPGTTIEQSKDSFNFYHSRTWMVVERAFGHFKKRWGMYARPSMLCLGHF